MSRRSRSRKYARAADSGWPNWMLPRAQERVRLDRLEELLNDERRFVRNGVPQQFVARRLRFNPRVLSPLSARRAPEPTRRRADSYGFLRGLPRLPKFLKVCVARKQRKEVMFALDIAGRRGVGAGKPRRVRSRWSLYSC